MIHVGDNLDLLPALEPESIQCCVTSPPYFGLRDYGIPKTEWPEVVYRTIGGELTIPAERCCLGFEDSPEAFVGHLVLILRQVHRALRDDGTLWLNLGDSYATRPQQNFMGETHAGKHTGTGAIARYARPLPLGTKAKDMIGIPWMVAFALRADGWYLRQEIIWSKPNPMPESITDRCTKSHEHLFLLAKSPKYYFDQEAILEPCSPNTHARLAQDVQAQIGSDRVPGKTNGTMKAVGRSTRNGVGWGYEPGSGTKNNGSFDAAMAIMPEKRNKRSVWTVTTQPFKEAHFATFPPALIEPCILAGSRPGDLVLDPYMGAGTTAVVCERLGRRWVGCELNPDYAEIARRRIGTTQPGLALGSAA